MSTATKYQVATHLDTTYRDTTSASYTYSSLKPNTLYGVGVRAGNAGGWSSAASTTCRTLAPPLPDSATGLKCSQETASSIRLTWEPFLRATGAEVADDASTITDAKATWESVDSFSSRYHVFTGLTAGDSYHLRLRGTNSAGAGASASKDCPTLPPAPGSLECSAETVSSIRLDWASANGATSYQVPQSPAATLASDATWETADSVTDRYHVFTGLTAGTTYKLAVRATNSAGAGASASKDCPTLPPAPSGIECSSIASTAITVEWDALTGATGYRVSDDGDDVDVAGYSGWVNRTSSQTSYEFTGLDANTAYDFRAQAQNAAGWSASAEEECTTKLASPANLDCSAETASAATLGWDAVTGASGYEVTDAASDVDDDDATWVDATGRSHEFSSLSANTSYDFRVRATSSSNTGESASTSCLTLPPAPTGFECSTIGSTAITVEWIAVSGAAGYQVSSDGGTTWVAAMGTSHEFPGLDSNTSYDLEVQAQNATGWGASASTSCLTLLPAPSGIECSSIASTAITVEWDALTGATGYRVSDDGDDVDGVDYSGWVNRTSSQTSYEFTGLDANTAYDFRAQAQNAAGWSASAEEECTTKLAPPANLVCSAETATSITLSWNAVSGATRYQVSSDGGETWVSATGVSHVFTGLIANVEYELVVRAGDADDWDSDASKECPTLVGPCVAVSSNSITVEWEAGSNPVHQWLVSRPSDTGGPPIQQTLDADVLTATFTGLEADTTYTFSLWRKAAAGENWTPQTDLTCRTRQLPGPSNLACTAMSTSITLGWDAVTGATRYQVSSDGGQTWADASGTSHDFSGLALKMSFELVVQTGDADDWYGTSSKTCSTTGLPGPSDMDCSAETATSITLGWNAVTGATRYQVSSDGGQTWVLATDTSHVFSSLTVSTDYDLVVQTGNADDWHGTSAKSCSTSPLEPPANLVCSDRTATSITLGWDAVSGATRYQVSSDGGETWVLATGVSHSFAGLIANVPYELVVQAGDAGDWDSEASKNCSTLVGPCVAVSSGSITVEWEAGSDPVHQWLVSRPSDSGGPPIQQTLNADVLTATFTGLESDTTYTFSLWRKAAAGESWTVQEDFTCRTRSLPAPSNLACTATSTSITLSWDPVEAATRYRVSRDGAPGFTVTQASYEFTELTVSTSYDLEVEAGDADGWGGSSTKECSTSLLPGPTNLVCTATATSITLTWDAVAHASGYRVAVDGGLWWPESQTSHLFPRLTVSTEYSLQVQTGHADGSWDGISSKTCSTSLLPGPTNLECSGETDSSITLGWDAVTGATRYQVSSDSGQTWAAASETSHTFNDLAANTAFTLKVQAGDSDSWDGDASLECSTEMGQCTATTTTITIKWETISGVHQWFTARATTGDRYTASQTLAAGVLTATFTGLESNTSYTFYLWWKASSEGDWTRISPDIECKTSPLPGPDNLACSAVAAKSITLGWDSVTGATRYQVSSDNGQTWVQATGTSHTFTGLASDTEYEFVVQTGDGDSWDDQTSKSCSTTKLPAPSNLTCTVTASTITLEWDEVVGATSYQVSQDGGPWWSEQQSSHESTDLSPGTTYEFVVRAGDGKWGVTATKTCTTSNS